MNKQLRIKLLSLAYGGYVASRMFCSAISSLYITWLGITTSRIFLIYAVHNLALAFLNLPVSLFADTVSRKAVFLTGLACVILNYITLFLLGCGKIFFWHESQSVIPILFVVVTLLELLYSFGRLSISGALDGWILNQFPPETRRQDFAEYGHQAQAYASSFSLVSGMLGILIAWYVNIAWTYLLASLGLLVSLQFYRYLIKTEPSFAKEPDEPAQATNDERPKTTWQSNFILSLKEILTSPAMLLATLGFTSVAFSRCIVFHFWQLFLIGRAKNIFNAQNPRNFYALLAYNACMYLGQWVSNFFIKKCQKFSTRYFIRGSVLMGLGAIGGLVFIYKSRLEATQSFWVMLPMLCLAFSFLQSAVASSQTINNNLFFADANRHVVSTMFALMFCFSKLATFCLTLCCEGYQKRHEDDWGLLYAIPVGTLLSFALLMWPWKRRVLTKRKTLLEPEKTSRPRYTDEKRSPRGSKE